MSGFRERCFRPDELRKLGSYAPDQPPLRIGDYAELNSGSPPLLVVESDAETVTLSWQDAAEAPQEETLPRACLHRVPFIPAPPQD